MSTYRVGTAATYNQKTIQGFNRYLLLIGYPKLVLMYELLERNKPHFICPFYKSFWLPATEIET